MGTSSHRVKLETHVSPRGRSDGDTSSKLKPAYLSDFTH
jgi:hypothetical protein